MAYVARYAHQPLPVLLEMTREDFREFHAAVSRIVAGENRQRPEED